MHLTFYTGSLLTGRFLNWQTLQYYHCDASELLKKNTLGMVIMWTNGPGQRVTHHLLTGPSPVCMWLISNVENIIYYRAYYTLHSSKWLWPTGHTPSTKRQGNSSSNEEILSMLQYNAVLDSSANPASVSQPLMTKNLSKAVIVFTSISMNWRLGR